MNKVEKPEDIKIQKLLEIQEDFRIRPTKCGENIMKEGSLILEKGFIFEVKVKKKWHLISCGIQLITTLQKGLAMLHNNGYINLEK